MALCGPENSSLSNCRQPRIGRWNPCGSTVKRLMIELSKNTRARVEAIFPEEDRDRVADLLLRECGDNLPLVGTSYRELAERIRFAVLRLSGGNFERLVEASREASIDWRDCLVAAGFGDDPKAHLAWEPGVDLEA